MRPLTDAHCHAHELGEDELARLAESFEMLVAVSDDLESSLRTAALAEKFKFLVPCVGIHPWSLRSWEAVEGQLRELERVAVERGIQCLGEVGLDLAFVPQTYELQLKTLGWVLDLAKDLDLAVNMHAAKAWRQALDEVGRRGLRRVLFHWYTGPIDVLAEIATQGYLISINPTVKVSRKHLEVAKFAPLHAITFESDGPYEYRGLSLTPRLIPEAVSLVASERGVDVGELAAAASENLRRFLEVS